jgi:hypothetical protein
MTRNEFVVLCLKYNIAPEIALENENVVRALKAKDTREVENVLRDEF